jgi:hypothetical protein
MSCYEPLGVVISETESTVLTALPVVRMPLVNLSTAVMNVLFPILRACGAAFGVTGTYHFIESRHVFLIQPHAML